MYRYCESVRVTLTDNTVYVFVERPSAKAPRTAVTCYTRVMLSMATRSENYDHLLIGRNVQ